MGRERRYIKNESQRGAITTLGPCLLSSLGRSPFNALSFPLEWGSTAGLALAVFGRHSRAQNRTWKKNNCPMSLPHAGWGAWVGVAAASVCVGRLHAIPAGQAPASLISAGSRPNGWAAWVPLVIAIAEQNLQSGQALEAHCPVSIRWNRETAKVWSPGSSTVRPRAREHPGGIIQGTSAAAPQCAPPALPRAAP